MSVADTCATLTLILLVVGIPGVLLYLALRA
jgi:hypothetical protein